MDEMRGIAYWQLNDCPDCGGRHPRNCPDCWNGEPACSTHVCSWPEDDDED